MKRVWNRFVNWKKNAILTFYLKEPGGVPANTPEKKVTNTALPQKKLRKHRHSNLIFVLWLIYISLNVLLFLIDNLRIFYRQKIRLILTEMLDNSCLQDICTEIQYLIFILCNFEQAI